MKRRENRLFSISVNKETQKLYFEKLYSQTLHFLCLAAYKVLRDKDRAHDCVQDLFLELWEKDKVEYLMGLKDIEGYLYISVKNRCYKMLAIDNKNIKEIAHLALTTSEILQPTENDSKYTEMFFKEAMSRMPPQPHRALVLHVIQGRKRTEVATMMGVSINTVKTHLKIAFKIMRESIVKKNY